MNTHHLAPHTETLQNRFGLRVAARLSAGAEALPHDITERLRAAREQALAQRKQPLALAAPRTAGALSRDGSSATLAWGEEGLGWWGRLVSVGLALLLVAGLVTISVVQEDDRTTEMAELDAALLTDDLPPEAYADPGFLQFLKSGAGTPGSISR